MIETLWKQTLLRFCLMVRHTIEALRAGQSRPENWTVIFSLLQEESGIVSRAKLALLSWALLLCIIAGGAQAARSQTAARPTPAATPASTPADIHANVNETLIDSSLPDDAAVDKMLEAYSPKVRALDQVIGKLKGDLKKSGIGSGSLGNFVTDAMRAQASAKLGKPIVLAVTNSGGLRRSVIPEGDLRVRDIFELMPFENALVAFDLTGAQVLKLLGVAVSFGDAQSGARITYRTAANKRPELEQARLLVDGQEKEIDPAATYTVISIDYLWKRRSSTPSETEGNYSILSEGKNIRPLGLTIRDALIDYIKAETAAGRDIKSVLDGRFVFDKAASGTAEEPKP
jgi:2',3'-cyclic-nucleotide 2'-phosphodiesterase (5'-nucleotidase family)